MKNESNIVILKGEIDIFSIDEFKKNVGEKIDFGFSDILLECTDLTYIDSTGISALIELRKKTIGNNQNLCLLNPQRNIKKLLTLTGVDKILEIVETNAYES
ncbi:MAG: STAS domain-containing protein [Eubacteriaceae bacterium]